MIARIVGWWRERQRRIDLQTLWPACVEVNKTIDAARWTFLRHATHDPAWTCLGVDETLRRVAVLERDMTAARVIELAATRYNADRRGE